MNGAKCDHVGHATRRNGEPVLACVICGRVLVRNRGAIEQAITREERGR